MLALKAIGPWLIILAGHAARITIDADLQFAVDRLQGSLQAANAFGKLCGVVCEFCFVAFLLCPGVVEDNGVESRVYQSVSLHAFGYLYHLVVADGTGKPVPCEPAHHGGGRLQVAADDQPDLGLLFFAIRTHEIYRVGVFALCFWGNACHILVFVARLDTVFFERKR